jgi:hypothetical protein
MPSFETLRQATVDAIRQVDAMRMCRDEGLFDANTLLSGGSTDPDAFVFNLALMWPGISTSRLQPTHIARRWDTDRSTRLGYAGRCSSPMILPAP